MKNQSFLLTGKDVDLLQGTNAEGEYASRALPYLLWRGGGAAS